MCVDSRESSTDLIKQVLIYLTSISNQHTMPFTIAQLTAFWTGPAQMGLTARTRVQMAAEGLATPDDFEDFPEKEDLEGMFKQLLKPAKTPGLGVNALPQ
jgi:hypothetical protein